MNKDRFLPYFCSSLTAGVFSKHYVSVSEIVWGVSDEMVIFPVKTTVSEEPEENRYPQGDPTYGPAAAPGSIAPTGAISACFASARMFCNAVSPCTGRGRSPVPVSSAPQCQVARNGIERG